MKKVVCILGSPRSGGNSESIARKILDTAEKLGAQTQVFALNSLNYKGCQACLACKTGTDSCAIKDDLTEVLSATREADVLVITSPVYYGEITGQLKSYIDRTYSFIEPDFMTNPEASRIAPGKKCIFVYTQGDPDVNSFDFYKKYDIFFQRYGFENFKIHGTGLNDKNDASRRDDLMQQAEEIAKAALG